MSDHLPGVWSFHEAGRQAFLVAVTLTYVHVTFMKQVGLAQIGDEVSIGIAIEAGQH
jgi:hypothetical protein